MVDPVAAVGGLMKIGAGLIGGRKRRREQRAAQAEFNTMKDRYAALDTSNPYKDISNTFEDLTVNTQAADFAAQQSQQGAANVMSSLSAAAGGSGIAALAQSLANSQAQQAQAASASIAQQESRNQQMAAQGEAQRQQMIAAGERQTQQMEAAKTSQMLGMASQRLGAAKEARSAATSGLLGGITDMVGVAGDAGLLGGLGEGIKNFLGGKN
tara:strand:- start:2309 stop:2944 length:636 start_codon:yes stop_codon:yes gene_type:complete